MMVLISPLAAAHPHSFISLKTTLVSQQPGMLNGLHMVWKMDEITSSDLLYDAGDAKPDSVVWKKLAAEVMANVLGQHYFSEFWHNGQRVKFDNLPTEYHLAREGHQAVLTFVLPLAEPQPLTGQTYTFMTFDPTYFVDMFYDDEESLQLPQTLQNQCKINLKTPKPDASMQAYALSLDKADAPAEEMDLGRQFAQTVTLVCQ
ncbi:ABC-type uncharacterized transport system substrate-binding protein [Erwinia toletana]|uniref:ABC-type uncharacterized transport system substrate-binding protein n=1 Tax=Winslowiella toletana TaxID=92490 RepID=A0ABS4P5J8_9GAMM|nr:DUF1007 family protein [Winslowiella toletana]MBP2167903.1 ABC-type uncharacterized transport system substrate-binding protein [Winslowiella toletana]